MFSAGTNALFNLGIFTYKGIRSFWYPKEDRVQGTSSTPSYNVALCDNRDNSKAMSKFEINPLSEILVTSDVGSELKTR